MFEVVGDTEFKRSGFGGQAFEVISHDLTPDGGARALFAVGYVEDMTELCKRSSISTDESLVRERGAPVHAGGLFSISGNLRLHVSARRAAHACRLRR